MEKAKVKAKVKGENEGEQNEGEGDNNEEEDRDEEDNNNEDEDRDGEDNNEEGDEGENGNDGNGVDISWVAGYSLKFQGCHQIKQWNADADEDNDVRIVTKRLARFRLCPSSSCSSDNAAGCNSGYGDYILDLDTYLQAYYEAKKEIDEAECENYLQNTCNCGDDGERRLDEEDCEYNCFTNAGMYQCIDDDEDGFNAEDYMACAQLDGGNDDANAYFVGPYCAEQGGAVFLGMFTDDSCTESAKVTFKSVQGSSLPYENESIIGSDCMSCAEMADGNDDGNDEDGVSEQCEAIYYDAGKCETSLPSGTVYEKNTNGCNYMEGIKIVRENGVIVRGSIKPSPAATAFIVIFAMLFAAMAFYVWYLRMRLGVKKNTLL